MAKEPVEQTFAATREQAWSALRAVIAELNYKDVVENPSAGTIEFRTGLSWSSWQGQQMTATIREAGPNATQVSLTGGVALKVQVTSWGEKKRIAAKVLAGIESKLAGAPA
jgi:hypothetical protein